MITGKSWAIYDLIRDRENRNTCRALQEPLTILWPQALHLLLLLRTREFLTEDQPNSRIGNVFCRCDPPRCVPECSLTWYTILSSISAVQTVLCLLRSAATNKNVPLSLWRRLVPENVSPSETRRQGGACCILVRLAATSSPYARPQMMLTSHSLANACRPTMFSTGRPG